MIRRTRGHDRISGTLVVDLCSPKRTEVPKINIINEPIDNFGGKEVSDLRIALMSHLLSRNFLRKNTATVVSEELLIYIVLVLHHCI
ncbi:hypothetical protein Y032_0683g1498 [Ancylostoma ceylanicum]|uniref:Uncharacterized protein n=1 Tax=Ancylostoma ceylanicum TaxID=53326 RepID=A0A016WIY6_9BILA|nr:hypothetical protein Y032_0683g1498 [Ancylostoma ceylanicum]